MARENEDEAEMERMRIQMQALASHPQSAAELLKALARPEDEPQEEIEGFDEVEWVTPQSEEEIEELMRSLNAG